MSTLIDRIFLFLFCIPGMLLYNLTDQIVIALFASVALSSFHAAFTDRRTHCITLLVYAVLLLFLSEAIIFLPVMTYDLVLIFFEERKTASRYRHRISFLCMLCILLAVFFSYKHATVSVLDVNFPFPALSVFFLVTGCLTAAFLCIKTVRYKAISHTLHRTRDDSTEIQLLLEERNKALHEQQNSEIHNATLSERNRIAREIHDNVGHMLTRSILMVGALKAVNREASLKEPLEQLSDTLNHAMDSIRKSVHDLRDSSVNLKETLHVLTSDFSFCPVSLQLDYQEELPCDLKFSIISIVKEALVNIARHSNATDAGISILEHPGFYQIMIWDNGTTSCRINNTSDLLLQEGMGLQNIRSRVKVLNGNLQITNANGFRIYITIPK